MSQKKKPAAEIQEQYETNIDIDKSEFEFVQQDDKIYDKKFETKPIGYFRDAMTRFAKNRTNVYATVILFTLIFLSIVVPMVTTKRYTGQEYEVRFLPPRVPIVERFGFLDGMERVRDQRVDRATIDPETGLGIPPSELFNPDFIQMDTLQNYTTSCQDRQDFCYGGQNILRFDDPEPDDDGMFSALLQSQAFFSVNPAQNPVLRVEIADLSEGSTLNLWMNTHLTPTDYDLVLAITEPGVYDIDFQDAFENLTFFSSLIQLELVSEDPEGSVSLDAIRLFHGDTDDEENIFQEDYGYDLSLYALIEGDANYHRRNGEILWAEFRFDRYQQVYGERLRRAFSANRYYALLEANEDLCVRTEHPDNPDLLYTFSEGCPVTRVLRQTEPVERDGELFYSYDIVVDYAIISGFDDLPYYFFGTDASGRDLFALSWLALRTSLFIGVTIAFINISIGIIYGAIEGYYGGRIDLLMERFAEIIGRIPWLVTLSIFVALLGAGVTTLMAILIFSGWIGISGITRTQFYRYKGREYVLASRTLGAKDSRLIFRHILPNAIGTIITASILSIPLVIFAESTISYLGFGIGHGVSFSVFGVEFSGVSIGVLLADGRTHMFARPYLTVFPAIIISILMITFNMFGNALRDAFNPSLRGVE